MIAKRYLYIYTNIAHLKQTDHETIKIDLFKRAKETRISQKDH